jgi:hypothetical protein
MEVTKMTNNNIVTLYKVEDCKTGKTKIYKDYEKAKWEGKYDCNLYKLEASVVYKVVNWQTGGRKIYKTLKGAKNAVQKSTILYIQPMYSFDDGSYYPAPRSLLSLAN